MAAVSSSAAAATTTLTPPSNQNEDLSWDYAAGQEDPSHNKPAVADSALSSKNPASSKPFHFDAQMATRRMHSADNLSATARWDLTNDDGALSPPFESKTGSTGSAAEWPMQGSHRRIPSEVREEGSTEDGYWIHRDKLAQIESRELQAAGIFVPRARAPSKPRGERSHSRLRKGAESTEPTQPLPANPPSTAAQSAQPRSRKNSTAIEAKTLEVPVPSWDLRTAEEIAEAEANAYFQSNELPGGSRIPMAKASPAPIPLDYLEHGSAAAKWLPDSPEDDDILYSKPRSRSDAEQSATSGKRSVSGVSPKKTAQTVRKTSAPAKAPANHPKKRSGSSSGTRPSTRSGGSGSSTKPPEGDPPWMVNSYAPDPRLPPDQQLLPTVARRLAQEKWEKEGKFGNAYDKEFRPLNDKPLPKPLDLEKGLIDGELGQDQWPLKPEGQKSPSLRQGAYSTMPKISDNPPMTPGGPRNTNASSTQNPPTRVPEQPEDEKKKKKGGCDCCVVM